MRRSGVRVPSQAPSTGSEPAVPRHSSRPLRTGARPTHSVVRELSIAWTPGEDRGAPWNTRGHVAGSRADRRRADGKPDGGSAMSVTVPFGAQEDAGSEPGPGRAQAQETAPAVVYLAAAKNTYGTAVVPPGAAAGGGRVASGGRDGRRCLWLHVARRLAPSLALHPRWHRRPGGALGGGRVDQPGTWLELRDALDSGLPCWFVTGSGDLAPVVSISFRLYPTGVRTVRRWAHAVLPDT